jgi:hypothetical protein
MPVSSFKGFDAMTKSPQPSPEDAEPADKPLEAPVKPAEQAPEIGGRPGPDPTRYQDWERGGRCIDF